MEGGGGASIFPRIQNWDVDWDLDGICKSWDQRAPGLLIEWLDFSVLTTVDVRDGVLDLQGTWLH